jgi:O-antigen ligase
MWLDSPIFGHGFGSYAELGPTYGDPILNSPHSEWFRLFAEEGLFGGLIGLGFAVSVLLALARAPGWLGAGAFAAALGYFIAACFNNPFLFLQVGVPAYLVIGTGLGWAARVRAKDDETELTGGGEAAAVMAGSPAA